MQICDTLLTVLFQPRKNPCFNKATQVLLMHAFGILNTLVMGNYARNIWKQ